ncbi:MAG TPA: hypothetical protein VIH54_09760, partial [Chthoniobacterales bacterium]
AGQRWEKKRIEAKQRKQAAFPSGPAVSDRGSILLCLVLSALCQGCAPTDVHVHPKSAISEASRTVQKSGQRTRLTSEFLETAKLEGNNSAVNRVAEQRYLKLALDVWAALRAAKDQSDSTLLEIHNQALANYLQLLSPGDLAIGTADEIVDGRRVLVVLRDGAKPDHPPNLAPADKDWVDHVMFFAARHDISRAIFMASPFKGSKTADLILFRFSSRLVRFPTELEGHHYRVFTRNRSYMVYSKENRLIAKRQPSSSLMCRQGTPRRIVGRPKKKCYGFSS